MSVTVIEAGAQNNRRPQWLAAFERVRLAPREGRERRAAGSNVLVYVLDGVLQIRHDAAALDRALPGELLCVSGIESLGYANGSATDTLEVCEWALRADPVRAARVEQRYFPDDDKRGALCQIARAADAQPLGDDALIQAAAGQAFVATLGKWETVLHNPAAGASNWLHVLEGIVSANGHDLIAGVSAWVSGEEELRMSGREPATLLLLEGVAGNDQAKQA